MDTKVNTEQSKLKKGLTSHSYSDTRQKNPLIVLDSQHVLLTYSFHLVNEYKNSTYKFFDVLLQNYYKKNCSSLSGE